MKKIAILGSTGSIGTQTLDVVRANEDLEVVGLSAGSNVEKLEEQIREFRPKLVAVWKDEAARDLAVRVKDLNVKIVSGMGGLIELARMKDKIDHITAAYTESLFQKLDPGRQSGFLSAEIITVDAGMQGA